MPEAPSLKPVFIGLNLAWSDRNRSGGAILRAGSPGRVA